MDNLLLCTNAILPMLLMMLLGYLLKRIRFLSREGLAAFDKLCFNILIPAMLFESIYTADFSQSFQPRSVLFALSAIFVVFLLSFLLVPRLCESRAASTIVHGLTHGNLAVLGLTLIGNLFAPEQMAIYAILLAFVSPFVNSLCVFERIWLQGGRLRPLRLLWKIVSSPFVVGTLLGLACNLLGIRFPQSVQTAISNLQSIGSPLCLIALGGSFSFATKREKLRLVALTVLSRCVFIPIAVMGAALLLGFRGASLASMMVIFCSPCATATYSFCAGYGGDAELASQLVVYSTTFSIVSMFAWLYALLERGFI